ncbi:MAG: histone deacetylase, partial [Candidatus Aminicenantes bacterium]|nr:histone deacetylase [Candidatus Aminicenantes bacterium]
RGAWTEIPARPASDEEIGRIHTARYIKLIKDTAGQDRVVLDGDTSTSAGSAQAALLAAGGSIEAASAVMRGDVANAFAFVRPPGHHAEADRAMGFCLFNNAAIAARALIDERGLKRILIVDWDLHHGNGTQNAFYETDRALYFSIHQSPHYPGSGHWRETGRGPGEGCTLNVPLWAGKGDADYLHVLRTILEPAALAYKPEFVIVSAGFDIYGGDPLGGMEVTAEGFAALTAEMMDIARECCGGRIVHVLEGGYNGKGLKEGAKAVLDQLGGRAPRPAIAAAPSHELLSELEPMLRLFRTLWPI